MPTRQHVKLHLSPAGRGTVIVDGEDWSNRVSGVRLESAVGTLTRVWVQLTDVEVEFDGEAYVDASSIVDLNQIFRPVKRVSPNA